jgi:hypothetical protein
MQKLAPSQIQNKTKTKKQRKTGTELVIIFL